MTCYAACSNNKLELYFNVLRDIFNALYNEEDSGNIWELLSFMENDGKPEGLLHHFLSSYWTNFLRIVVGGYG